MLKQLSLKNYYFLSCLILKICCNCLPRSKVAKANLQKYEHQLASPKNLMSFSVKVEWNLHKIKQDNDVIGMWRQLPC